MFGIKVVSAIYYSAHCENSTAFSHNLKNPRWRWPPSRIFRLCEFGYSGVLIVICALYQIWFKYRLQSLRSTHLSFRPSLMTLRELTSGFAFWSRGYLRMAVMHLPVKFGADIFIQSGVINIFPKFKMAVIFRLYKFGHSGMLTVWYWCAVPNLVQISVIVTHLSFRPSFDGVTRINFRFRLLVAWSSSHGRDASSYKIWCRYLYPFRSY